MESHTGIVAQIKKGKAIVSLPAQGCGGCGQRRSCGIGKLAADNPQTLVELDVPSGLAIGDPVTVSLAEDKLLVAALVGYLLPAVSLVSGAIFGSLLAADANAQDVTAVLGAAAGFGVGIAVSRLLARRFPGLRLQATVHAGK